MPDVHFVRMIFLRAFHDTFDGRAARTMFFIVSGAALSLAVVWFWLGPTEAMSEIPFIVAGLIGAIGPLLVLFLWNLACAPYRMERDAHNATKAELEKTGTVLAYSELMQPLFGALGNGQSKITFLEFAPYAEGERFLDGYNIYGVMYLDPSSFKIMFERAVDPKLLSVLPVGDTPPFSVTEISAEDVTICFENLPERFKLRIDAPITTA